MSNFILKNCRSWRLIHLKSVPSSHLISSTGFYECLKIRRHVYAYARVGCSSEETNPTHLEVSCVLHELGSVGFSQKRYSKAMEMLLAERAILERLEEQSAAHNDRLYQARLTNLTWLKKCAKKVGDENKVELFSFERQALKLSSGHKSTEIQQQHLHSGSISLEQKALTCRLLARKFALEKKYSQHGQDQLSVSLDELLVESRTASSGPMKEAAIQFHGIVLHWIEKPGRRSPILTACDGLR